VQKISHTAATLIVTFFVTLGLNTAVNYYSWNKGAISVSRSVVINGVPTIVVSIENYSSDFLDGLALEVPYSVGISDISTDSPLTLATSSDLHPGASRVVKIGQVTPRQISRLFVSGIDAKSTAQVRVINASALGVTVSDEYELISPLQRAFSHALITASVYACFGLVIYFFASRAIRELRLRVDSNATTIEEANKRIKEVDRRFKALNRQYEESLTKQRVLLLARLSDYSKEINFWRNAARSILGSAQCASHSADELLEIVTKRFGTFGVDRDARQFDAVRVAAAWLADAERNFKNEGKRDSSG